MAHVYLLLGANLGDREQQLQAARTGVLQVIGPITRQSGIYETDSWGNEEKHPAYLNQVIEVVTERLPEEILREINAIEAKLGRVRNKKWDPRIIDIDILFYGNEVVDLPHLQIPHPYFQDRNFAMIPMNEIAPGLVHPLLGISVGEILRRSRDPLGVRPFQSQAFENNIKSIVP